MTEANTSPNPRLQAVTQNVYVLPGDMRIVRPWIGVVVTDAGVVLVDSGNGPAHGRDVLRALEPLGRPPVTHILLTHHHWDHVFGNCAFPDAHIVAHEKTQRHLKVMAREPWSPDYVRAKAAAHPKGEALARMMLDAVPDWDAFRAVPAAETFQDRHELRLGDTTLTVEHVGGQHEPDQCIVHVRPANVLFLGDAVYGRGAPDSWDSPTLIHDLEAFLARGADYYVEGHRSPADRRTFADRIEQLRRDAAAHTSP
ncbi:MAG: MBL fold metallo-hydrolase [Candidatus Promineifilaceae bacterium]|nr:MBL fold metallo-hydrolase [Candidatus Promineifilaceae bacterium]